MSSRMASSVSVSSGRTGVAPSRRSVGLVALIALGMTLARRGPIAVVALSISALTIVVLCLVSATFARRGGDAPVHDVPLVASSLIAWGGGFVHAFSASASALRRDRASGIRHLFVTRTTSVRGYLVARIGGLAALLAAVIGGGTLLVGAVAILASTTSHALARTFQSTIAGFVFALAFAFVVTPIAFAALGARKRMSGYLFLLALLLVPEIIASSLTGPVPREVTELCALPSALAALRSALAPGTADAFRFVRALVALVVFAGVALFFVRRDIVLLEREEEPGA
jgi:hypothetical protein